MDDLNYILERLSFEALLQSSKVRFNILKRNHLTIWVPYKLVQDVVQAKPTVETASQIDSEKEITRKPVSNRDTTARTLSGCAVGLRSRRSTNQSGVGSLNSIRNGRSNEVGVSVREIEFMLISRSMKDVSLFEDGSLPISRDD